MKKLSMAIFCLVLATGGGWAQEKSSFWDGLLKKINKMVSHSPHRGKTYTSVVGIRGAEEDTSSDSLYWKGKVDPQAPAPTAKAEVSAFKSAVRLAEKGQRQPALTAFNQFLSDYPESILAPEAQAAIAHLEKPAPTAPDTPADAQKDQPE